MPTNHRIFLTPVATTRAIECDITNARSWEAGTGIAGASYSNRCEVVIPDLSRPGLKELFGTNANERKGNDVNLYRSMAASPIRLDGHVAPWGVVVATNDQINHFNADGFAAMRPDIVVKELAALLALAAAAYLRVADQASRAPLPEPPASGTEMPNPGLWKMLQRIFSGRRPA